MDGSIVTDAFMANNSRPLDASYTSVAPRIPPKLCFSELPSTLDSGSKLDQKSSNHLADCMPTMGKSNVEMGTTSNNTISSPVEDNADGSHDGEYNSDEDISLNKVLVTPVYTIKNSNPFLEDAIASAICPLEIANHTPKIRFGENSVKIFYSDSLIGNGLEENPPRKPNENLKHHSTKSILADKHSNNACSLKSKDSDTTDKDWEVNVPIENTVALEAITRCFNLCNVPLEDLDEDDLVMSLQRLSFGIVSAFKTQEMCYKYLGKKEKEEILGSLNHLGEKVICLEEDNEQLTLKVKQLSLENQQLLQNSKPDNLKDELTEKLKGKIMQLERKISTKDKEYHKVLTQLNSLKNNSHDDSSQQSIVLKQLAEKTREAEILRRRLTEQNDRIVNNSNELENLKLEYREVKSRYDLLAKEKERTEFKCKEFQELWYEATERTKTIQAELLKLEKEKDQILTERKKTEMELIKEHQNDQKLFLSAKETYDNLSKKVQEQIVARNTQQRKMNVLSQKIVKLSEELNKVKEERTALNESLSSVTEENNKSKALTEKLEVKLTNQKKKFKELIKWNEKLLKMDGNMRKEIYKTVEDYESKASELERVNSELKRLKDVLYDTRMEIYSKNNKKDSLTLNRNVLTVISNKYTTV